MSKKIELKSGQKGCNGCKQGKNFNEFGTDNRRGDKLSYRCKECNKKYYQKKKKDKQKEWYSKNFDRIKTYKKEYDKNRYKKDKNKLRKGQKEWYNKNKLYIKNKNYINGNSYVPIYSKYFKEIEKYEETRVSENGNIECKCSYCGCGFEPLYKQINIRIRCINGMGNGYSEGRLYCSVQCKQECPIYNQILYPKDFKPATSREVQPQLRQLVFERDNYTCQKCNKHKDDLDVGLHCHHKYPLNENPIESADVDACITLCENCHKWIHQNVAGCGYGEMRCSK